MWFIIVPCAASLAETECSGWSCFLAASGLAWFLCGISSRKRYYAQVSLPGLALAECASLLWQVFDTAEQELAVTGQPASSRGCKYALNTLMQTFQLKAMAANVAAGPV